MAKRPIFEDDSASEYEQMAEHIPDDDAMEEILSEYEEEEEESEPEQDDEDEAPQVATSIKKKAAYSMNTAETGIMDMAIVQLEQAKLYDMFLKHNLFAGVKANKTALQRVEKELKGFILERMQILLGMKQDKKTQTVQQVKVELPFNDVEIEFLKALSLKGTGGASAKAKPVKATGLTTLAETQVEEDDEEEEQGLQGFVQEEEEEEEEDLPPPPPKKVVKKPVPAKAVAPVKKKLQPTPAPKKVSKSKVTAEEVAAHKAKLQRQGIRVDDATTRAALEDIKKMANRTPAHLMSEDQLREEARNNGGSKRVAPSNAIPMPNADAQVAHYMTRQHMIQSQNPENTMIQNLLAKQLGFSTTGVHQDNGED